MHSVFRVYVTIATSMVASACGDDGAANDGAGGAGGESPMTSSGSAGTGGMGGSSAMSGGAGGAGGAGGSGGSGGGSPLTIQNPGFEADPLPPGAFDPNITPTAWARYDPVGIIGQDFNSVGVLNPTGTRLYAAGAPEGSNVALVFLWRDETEGVAAGLSQELSHVLMANTEYTLSVKVGNIAPRGPMYDFQGFPGYRVELLAGGAVIAADDNTLLPAEGTFEQSTVSLTTGDTDEQLGTPLAIRLINLNTADSGIEVNFDDVEIVATALP